MNKKDILEQDITSFIAPEKMVKAFHANTIMSRILKKLETQGTQSRQGWTSLMDWNEEASKLAYLLPEDWLVINAKDGLPKNPFEGIKKAFGKSHTNASVKENQSIYSVILNMHNACLGQLGNEHLNLLEVLEDCNLVASKDVKEFCLDKLGQEKTPKETVEDFILEMEGSAMLGETTQKTFNSNLQMFVNKPTLKIIGNKLIVNNCESQSNFELYTKENHCVVIQKRNEEGTSITNLAEWVRDFLKEELGKETHIYEAYESDMVNGQFIKVDRILGEKGETAGWEETNALDIPGLKELKAYLL